MSGFLYMILNVVNVKHKRERKRKREKKYNKKKKNIHAGKNRLH